MDETALKKILRRQEGANLDFKRQWYELDSSNQKKAEADKGGMIKEILSLANGNTNVAGEISYLVIGASDEVDEQGDRELFDFFSEKPITRQRVLDIINPFCDPAIEDILCGYVFVEGKRLLVITIVPSPHVHETKKDLKTARVTYDKYTVFVRHAEGVRTASTKERIALQQLKKLQFSETKNVLPIPFGAVLGALIMGMMGPKILAKDDDTQSEITSKTIAGASVGAFFGGMVGLNYAQIKSIPLLWLQNIPKGKVVGSMGGSTFLLFFWWVTKYILKKRKSTLGGGE